MPSSTRATSVLEQRGVTFSVHSYVYDPITAQVGMQAAQAFGEHPERVLKTLMAAVDGRPVCVIVPSDREVSMKRLAAAFGGKAAIMMKPRDAKRLTGYVVGGISPFGQKRTVPTAIEAHALQHRLFFVNGGQRGLQLRLAPAVIVQVTVAIEALLVAG